MKLTVPTNWQDDLVKKISWPGVDAVYGKLDSDFVGGGRPSCIFLKINKKKVKGHIQSIHDKGLKFYYLLNSSCLGNREWTKAGQREIRELLNWLEEINVDGVVVAIPYLGELIRKQSPRFEICVSSFAQVNSVNRAKFWEDLGASVITLPQVELTRDFKLLKLIRENVKCDLQLIVNDNCLQDCPLSFYHKNLVSHASQTSDKSELFTINYCSFVCRYKMLSNPANFIRATWIRPEDIQVYEEIGINKFKLIDRSMTSDALARIVEAYSSRSYRGNLYDLFSGPSKNMWLNKPNYFHRFKYFFHPFAINIFKLIKERKLLKDIEVYIDNKKLDGFIKHFFNESCRYKSCDNCRYCYDIADKVIKIDSVSREALVVAYNGFLKRIISGEIFK